MLTEVKTVDKKIRDLIDRKTLTAGELHKSGEL
jgi:hypothetical protein